MALEVVLPNGGVAELTDTLRPSARALNGYGDSVMAEIFWASLDTATIAVLDSETGVTLAKAIGIGRLQARAGALRSNPQSVTVLARLDSMRADGPIRNTVTVSPPDSLTPPDSLSDSLRIAVFATGGAAERRRAVYVATVFPPGGPAVRVAPNDTVLTDGTGIAVAQVRLLAGPLPDSVVVTATVRRPAGAAIPGSPVTFVVEFRP